MANRERFKTDRLTPERACELLLYARATGQLFWRGTRPGCKAGQEAGTPSPTGYQHVENDQANLKAHRVIFLMQTGRWPCQQIDHVDGIRGDGRWCNLRDATPLQNARNRRPGRRNTSGHVGVTWDRRRRQWHAGIGYQNKTRYLGCLQRKADAIKARRRAERRLYDAFAWRPAR